MKSFIGYIDLNSRNYKITQITNLLDNSFDIFNSAIFETENSIRKKIKSSEKLSSVLKTNISNYTKQNRREPTEDEYKILEEILKYSNSINYLTEHLLAITEMKIAYLYKCLEIKILSLIKTAYPNKQLGKNFDWKKLILFFDKKNIYLTKLTGYKEVNDLRILNNCIKHSCAFNKLSGVPEFAESSNFSEQSLNLFHNRTKNTITTFFNDLAILIIDDLNSKSGTVD